MTDIVELSRVGAPSDPPAAFTKIDLKQIDVNLFLGEQATLWMPLAFNAKGVYGGQIVGQALSAALKTVPPEKYVHSLHSYFLKKGNPKRDIVYNVKNLKDGASFSSRLVTASQEGSSIFVMIASFQIPHPEAQRVIEHQARMPQVPSPEELPTMAQYYGMLLKDKRCPESWRPFLTKWSTETPPIDTRPVIVADFFAKFGPPPVSRPTYPQISELPREAMWIKCKSKLPDDPTVHAAVLAYASDMDLLGTAAKHQVPVVDMAIVASLDHAMWFHRKFRADEWLLYSLESPRATDGRGLAYGSVFTQSGELVVTVAQEGVLRLRSKG